ncbi:MAG: hypothetical protein RLZZ210_1000 [Pseudomonadota bacterium]|jgi:hypothetical protein
MHELSSILSKFMICASLVCSTYSTYASAQVFMCTGDDGVVEYTNNKNKNCKELKLQKLNVIPSSPSPYSSPSSNKDSFRNNANLPLPSFPSVSPNTQLQRDNDRKSILGKELSAESKKLQDLQKEYNAGQPERKGDEKNYQKYLDRVEQLKKEVQRAQGNVDSIKKEMGL